MEDQALQNFRPGIYLHYKGRLYEADHLMRDANNESRVGVHYIGQELDGAKDGPRHLIRTWEDWKAIVHTDGTVCERYDNDICLDTKQAVAPRFRYLGPYYISEMRHEKVWRV